METTVMHGSALSARTQSEARPPLRAPVSVVVPCYRCAETIGASVASIAAQSLPPAEVLLVDDCSGDGTLDALHELASRYPGDWIRVIGSPRNGGPSQARNIGWAHASQPFIAFLDADDTWAPAKLELQMAALRNDPGIALIAHRMDVRDRKAGHPSIRPPVRVRILGRKRLLLNNPFPTASVVLRRDLPFRFNENFRRVEDFLLWAQICFSGYRCAKINQTLASWHKANYGVGGLSGDLAAMHQAGKEVRRELLRQGLVTPAEHRVARVIGTVRRVRRNLMMVVRDGVARLRAQWPPTRAGSGG